MKCTTFLPVMLSLLVAVPQAGDRIAGLTFKDPLHPPRVGGTSYIVGLGGKAVDAFVATDYATLDEYNKYLIAGDTTGIEELAESGRLLIVKVGTRALMIKEYDFDVIDQASAWEARITDGEHRGTKVFVRPGEIGEIIRLSAEYGDRVTLSAPPGEKGVPVFRSPQACQIYIDAYRRKTGDVDVEFSETVWDLINEGQKLRAVQPSKEAILDSIVSIKDHMAVIRDPKDYSGATYYTLPQCVGAR